MSPNANSFIFLCEEHGLLSYAQHGHNIPINLKANEFPLLSLANVIIMKGTLWIIESSFATFHIADIQQRQKPRWKYKFSQYVTRLILVIRIVYFVLSVNTYGAQGLERLCAVYVRLVDLRQFSTVRLCVWLNSTNETASWKTCRRIYRHIRYRIIEPNIEISYWLRIVQQFDLRPDKEFDFVKRTIARDVFVFLLSKNSIGFCRNHEGSR